MARFQSKLVSFLLTVTNTKIKKLWDHGSIEQPELDTNAGKQLS
jgi:hypothetical protein